MIAVIQKVNHCQVTVEKKSIAEIDKGLLLFLGVAQEDNEKDAEYLAEKSVHLRIFADDEGKMNRSLIDIQGEMMVVSQFTLLGDCRKGRRPSFIRAADPDKALRLYDYFIHQVRKKSIPVQCGQFRALMEVSLINAGPVTLIIDSQTTGN
jgi:D-tyrosyl-tRNA(Tyr) deacylase